jgi:nitrate/nitrite transporter NarK
MVLTRPAPKTFPEYLLVLKNGDAWWFMLFYSVTFGGFVGLSLRRQDRLRNRSGAFLASTVKTTSTKTTGRTSGSSAPRTV